MNRIVKIPFSNIVEEDIANNLERYDDKSEKEIIDKVLDLDVILSSYLCLIIEEPQLENEERTIKERKCVCCIS